jgi:antitoxin CptB
MKSEKKLFWACRRGMLELDVLLGNFLEEVYPKLSEDEKKQFSLLLDQPDPNLFAWLMGHEKPQDPGLAAITEAIRNHARSRTHY